ncbi:MAG: hypothetical protein LBR44_09720 [Clostridiales Family XIII bacterium]|jgi:hypothetical protein|nr:hypothetical protein [Clostridiales Family XIII bacterium]
MNFEFAPEFEKEVKALGKRWRSLPKDIENVKPFIESLYTEQEGVSLEEHRTAFFNNKRATILHRTDCGEAVKMRLDCVSLGQKDIVRLIFVFIKEGDTVTFVELFSKQDKPREDERRLGRYL